MTVSGRAPSKLAGIWWQICTRSCLCGVAAYLAPRGAAAQCSTLSPASYPSPASLHLQDPLATKIGNNQVFLLSENIKLKTFRHSLLTFKWSILLLYFNMKNFVMFKIFVKDCFLISTLTYFTSWVLAIDKNSISCIRYDEIIKHKSYQR